MSSYKTLGEHTSADEAVGLESGIRYTDSTSLLRVASNPRMLVVGVIGACVILCLFVTVLALVIALGVEYGKNDTGSTDRPNVACEAQFTPVNQTFISSMKVEIRKALLSHSLFAGETTGVVFLEGATVDTRYYSDVELEFRQESSFLYLTGVTLPDCYFVIDLSNGRSHLLVPQPSVFYSVWNGVPESNDKLQEKYQVDDVAYTSTTEELLIAIRLAQGLPSNTALTVFTLGQLSVNALSNFTVNTTRLGTALGKLRQVKTDDEMTLLRLAADISAQAHISTMEITKPDLYEYSLASHFVDFCFRCGLQHQAYLPIVGAGHNSAILHYTFNDKQLDWKWTPTSASGDDRVIANDHNFVLIDAGAEYHGYAADVTRTYPVGGRFSREQAEVYNMVLTVQANAIAMCKPGVYFANVSEAVQLDTVKQLQSNGFVSGNVPLANKTIVKDISRVFLPHSFGHMLGLDVHDPRPLDVPFAKNMVFTVEPGIYFNEVSFQLGYNSTTIGQYLVREKMDMYLQLGIGGVRIEDDVLITDAGNEVLSGRAPRSISDIEKVLR